MTFERAKDLATIVGNVISVFALCFTAYQFYLGRLVLQSQAIHTATSGSVELQANMLKEPELYSSLLGVNNISEFKDNIAKRQIVAYYVVIYYDHISGVFPDDAWKSVVGEICALYAMPRFAPMINSAISNRQYPDGFVQLLKTCKQP